MLHSHIQNRYKISFFIHNMDRNIRDGLRQDKPSREPILIIEEKGDFFMAVDFKNSETKENIL